MIETIVDQNDSETPPANGPSVEPLPGGEVEVFSEQPWGGTDFPPEFMGNVVEAIRLYGRMEPMNALPKNFQDELGLLGRDLTDDELARLLSVH